ncbi:MAG: hypothetical protein AB7R55_23705, partial [Gemmatimonadales bacterium]
MRLEDWGWDEQWAGTLADPDNDLRRLARVVGQDRDRWSVQSGAGAGIARLPSAKRLDTYPAVGDWVLADPGPSESDPLSIRAVLPRRSAFVRATPLTGLAEQVLAANVDLAWIVHGLDRPSTLARSSATSRSPGRAGRPPSWCSPRPTSPRTKPRPSPRPGGW